MRRCRHLVLVIVAGATLGLPAGAADGPKLPPSAVGHKKPLMGERRVRYLLRQLDLSEQQAAEATKLLDSLFSPDAKLGPFRDAKVRALWRALDEAKQQKSKKKVEQIMSQLRRMNSDTSPEDEFFKRFGPQLSEAQQERLAAARARLKSDKSGGVRPGDLLRIARSFDLDARQKAGLFAAFKETRKMLGPVLRPSAQLKTRMVNHMADRIRALLTPEQRKVFEYRIRVLRPDLIDEGLRVCPEPPANTPKTTPPTP